MLNADLVRARVKGNELVLTELKGKTRARAVELADTLLSLVRERVGSTREEVKEAVGAIDVPPKERKLLDGLAKLVDDDCEFSEASELDPVELRREVFARAAEQRRALPNGVDFDRAAVLGEIAEHRGVTIEVVEAALFSDLRGAHQLLRAPSVSADALVSHYERAQVQAVLLRAVRVVARVHCASAGSARALFRKLKFHRLLYSVEELGGGDFELAIDGPYSLFESVTKYGLQLALVLPALEGCDSMALMADVRWGKQRRALVFKHEHHRGHVKGARGGNGPDGASDEPDLPDEVQALFDAFASMDTPWHVEVAKRLLDLPGVGLCVPDLVFSSEKRGAIFLEVLGYWSRDAVWKRVELVEGGLRERILFAVSARLRVSEEVLGGDESAALYVYKGTLSPRAIERKLNELADREV